MDTEKYYAYSVENFKTIIDFESAYCSAVEYGQSFVEKEKGNASSDEDLALKILNISGDLVANEYKAYLQSNYPFILEEVACRELVIKLAHQFKNETENFVWDIFDDLCEKFKLESDIIHFDDVVEHLTVFKG